MTRIYALERLLEHGGLTIAELIEITRWPRATLSGSLTRLKGWGIVRLNGKAWELV